MEKIVIEPVSNGFIIAADGERLVVEDIGKMLIAVSILGDGGSIEYCKGMLTSWKGETEKTENKVSIVFTKKEENSCPAE